MAEEIKKVEPPPQTPVQGAQDKKEAPPKEEAKVGPTGLDSFTADQLKEFYKRSPQMFEDAGIVAKKEEKKVEPPPEKKEEPPKPAVSAAPKYGEVEIKLPDDVPVNREAVDRYLVHAKEIGLDVKQVQAEIDFQTKDAREALKRQPPKEPTPAEVDAANVAKLKADPEFGGSDEKFKENMEIARRAAVKFGDKETLNRLVTSDPVWVKHFLKIGLADGEDKTPRGPNRTGIEGEPEEGSDDKQTTYLKQRYPHPSSQGMFK